MRNRNNNQWTWDKITHFKREEFDSPDKEGSGSIMDMQFVKLLDNMRQVTNIPMKINSGVRTISHNKIVGGKRNSSHLKGVAVDIHCNSSITRQKLITAAIRYGIKRIGIGNTFIHIDVDSSKSPSIWLY